MNEPPPRLSALTVTDHPDKGSQVGVIAKRTYLVRDGVCVISDEQVPLVEVPQVTEDESILLHDLDIVLNRREVDVIVTGKARPPGKARRFNIRVRVGPLDRRLSAFGDRRCWRVPDGRLYFSEPAPVDEIDLGWSSAYGGVDAVALQKQGDPIERIYKEGGQQYHPKFGLFAYPRNRAGKGYLIEATDEALDACALPNLEDPLQVLTPERLVVGRPDRWPTGILAASMGWLSYGFFPRCAMLGLMPLYDAAVCPAAKFLEVALGVVSEKSIALGTPVVERLDLGAAQQSAVGMRIPKLDPGAPVELVNLHPRLSTWTFALPRDVPLLGLNMPDRSPEVLEPKIRTVLIEPERDRICITWVGEHHEPIPVGPGKRAHIRHGVKWGG